MHRGPFFVVRIRFQIFADNFDMMEAESRLTSSRQQLLMIVSRYHIVYLTLCIIMITFHPHFVRSRYHQCFISLAHNVMPFVLASVGHIAATLSS